LSADQYEFLTQVLQQDEGIIAHAAVVSDMAGRKNPQ